MTAATSGCSSKKLASDSSASATIHSPSPQAALTRASARAGQLAAEEERRIGADRRERVGEHPRRRRLAVGAGDGDQALERAQLGEQLAAMEHPLPALAGPRQLGVVLGDRGRDDDVGVLRHGIGVVADAGSMPAAASRSK